MEENQQAFNGKVGLLFERGRERWFGDEVLNQEIMCSGLEVIALKLVKRDEKVSE